MKEEEKAGEVDNDDRSHDEREKESVSNEGDLDEATEYSDLSNPSRKIWVVTTASLPWRTGTAVNPLLRALCLTEGRSKGQVTLVVPWLERYKDRVKVYGDKHCFGKENGDSGKSEQEKWIRDYCKKECDSREAVDKLNIMFYAATFFKPFGSVFPTVDICSLIPQKDADVAILEEPEHLNWFCISSQDDDNTEKDLSVGEAVGALSTDVTSPSKSKDDKGKVKKEQQKGEKKKLGWAQKFNFVVGIIHTNYSAYTKQLAAGTSLIAAPALTAISALVVRAYCHKVIRLSAAIPFYAPGKEVTCNVHGVRKDFLEGSPVDPSSSTNLDETDAEAKDKKDSECAQVYFIGKLIWAKGFDQMLDVQDKHRSKTGEYFPIDIYGGGPDEKAIKRAFLGRKFSKKNDGDSTTQPSDLSDTDKVEARSANCAPAEMFAELAMKEADGGDTDNDVGIFSNPESLRQQIYDLLKRQRKEKANRPYDDDNDDAVFGLEEKEPDNNSKPEVSTENKKMGKGSVSTLGDFTEKSIKTGKATGRAVKNLAESAYNASVSMAFAQKKEDTEVDKGTDSKKSRDASSSDQKVEYVFDPPKSRFELRRNQVPARFLGIVDHSSLRTTPHKIFLNTSKSEVLCTTTAEALAMGKVVILPNHPSNTFFFQFPNCLPYKTLDECLEKLEWALTNDAPKLTEEFVQKFTWEAATERLIDASVVTKRQDLERKLKGMDKADERMARLHLESGKGGKLLGKVFGSNNPKKEAMEKEKE